jgi:hypothetical protein
MFLRWRRHRRDNKRASRGGESVKALHTGPAPIMPHNSARFTMFPPPPDQTDNAANVAFLPSGAAGWLNRLSGSPLRADSPFEERVRELPDDDEQGFHKVAGRKVPSQFPTGTEEGPAAAQFDSPDAMLAAPSPTFMKHERDSSGTSSNHTLNNNPEWFNSVHGPPAAVAAAAARSASPVSPVSNTFSTSNNRPYSFDTGNPYAGEQLNHAIPSEPYIPPKAAERTVSFAPPLFANGSSANTSPDERDHDQIGEQDFGRPDDVLRPSPARTPDVRETPPPLSIPSGSYNSPWGPSAPHPPDPGPTDQQSWYSPYSPEHVAGQNGRVESMQWPAPPVVDWDRLSKVRPKGI